MTRPSLALALAMTVAGVTPSAHHSLAGVYDDSQRITLTAVVVEFRFVNPHPLVVVEVTDETGHVRSWQLELDNRHELLAIGMTSDTFKPGDRVVATGSPGRTEPRLYVRRLDRPADRFWYEQVGSSPKMGGG
jgi:hypothetical protein